MIIIIGGNGFLGHHLRARIGESEQDIIIVSRRFDPDSLALQHRWISATDFSGREGDQLLAKADIIVYLATSSEPATFFSEPWQEVGQNVEPAFSFFTRCTAHNISAKIVLISSGGAVYGKTPPGRLITEDVAPAPISAYGLGKLMIEEALRFTGRTTGIPYSILRVANPVGKYQRSSTQGIISIALRALLSDRPFHIFGDGSHVRDYLDADDVAGAILAAARDKSYVDRTWNVGSGIGRSIIDILDLVAEVTGRSVPVIRHPARSIDVPYVVLDSTQIRRDIGWQTHHDLPGTIREIWEVLQMNLL